jgi:hypothetical protein
MYVPFPNQRRLTPRLSQLSSLDLPSLDFLTDLDQLRSDDDTVGPDSVLVTFRKVCLPSSPTLSPPLTSLSFSNKPAT